MARNLEDIFNECYERMRSGESLQSCLARYPEHRAELQSLLETAFDVGRRASYIHPRPEFKHWAQVRLQGAQHYHANQQRQVEPPSHFSWWRQSWAVAVTAVLILMLTTGSTMAASSNALPGETLYPVKLATEEMSLALAVTDTQKAQVQTQLVEARAKEVEALADRGNREEAALATERLIAQLEQANSAIAKIEGPVVIPPEVTTTTTPPEVTTTTTPPEVTTTTTPPETTTTTTPPETTTTTTPPEVTTTTTPPETTTTTTTQYDKRATARERLENRLEESKYKAQAALRNVHEKALEQDKPYWQRSIDKIKEKSKDKHDNQGWSDNKTWGESKSDNKTWGESKSDNKTWGGWQPNTVSPNQSQPYPWK